ncbi:Sensory box histidine kinase [gamma proteobacterium HdN1]|nr:Sensory box histidine kinase [gamma proteobacterium HdN1]
MSPITTQPAAHEVPAIAFSAALLPKSAKAKADRQPAANLDVSNVIGNLPATINLFQVLTDKLTASYDLLAQQVETLKDELVAADQALSEEVQAKETVTERMGVLLDVMPVSVITLDSKGVVDNANPAARSLLGSNVVSKKWAQVIDESFCEGAVCGNELLLKSGRVVSIATQPLSDQGGQVVVLTELTETRHLQNRINHLEKLSEMGRMMASLAHQIRTPLSSALIFTEHLAAAEAAEGRGKKRYAARVMEKLTQLDRQVKDMLIFSKAGFLMSDRINASDLQQRLAESARELLANSGGTLRVSGAAPQGMQLQCNFAYLISGFCNLIENAIQACEEKGVRPQLRLKFRMQSAGLLTVELSDNGPGVDTKQLDKVMEPFFTTKSHGTGLGLSVVYAVITGHGGAMDLANQEEGGLLVKIQLPLLDSMPLAVNAQ